MSFWSSPEAMSDLWNVVEPDGLPELSKIVKFP